MKTYTLSHCDYEGGQDFVFGHPQDKTQTQFEADCHMLLKKYGAEYLTQERNWAGSGEWLEYVAQKLPELGYTRPDAVWFSVFSTGIIKERDRHGSTVPHTEHFEAIVGTELIDKAVAHNKRVEKRTYRDRKTRKKDGK